MSDHQPDTEPTGARARTSLFVALVMGLALAAGGAFAIAHMAGLWPGDGRQAAFESAKPVDTALADPASSSTEQAEEPRPGTGAPPDPDLPATGSLTEVREGAADPVAQQPPEERSPEGEPRNGSAPAEPVEGPGRTEASSLGPKAEAPEARSAGQNAPVLAEADSIPVGTPATVAPPEGDWVPEVFRDCPVCPQMIRLPSGKHLMGDTIGEGDGDELPVHAVTLEHVFAIGVFEVSFDEWDACTADGGCGYRPDDRQWGRGKRPVINVSFSDVEAYLVWLSRKTGHRYRLPSEAEWEYAARAGSFDAYAGNDLASLCSYGNGAGAESAYRWRNDLCRDGYADRTAPAGSFKPNAFGLHDMMGNAWEWVGDCWHAGYEGASADGSAWQTGCAKEEHVLRGGAFSVDAAKLRVSYRYSFADKRMPFFGFRVVRDDF